jgi:hypothetical protein
MTSCDDPNTFCGGACTNTQTDPRNCGGCGKTCNTAMGETCQKGTCGPPCTGGTTRCGTVCLDVQNDPQNCGDCGKKCGVGEACTQGKCTLLCRSGLSACPRTSAPVSDAGMSSDASAPMDAGAVSASECVDLQSDPDNCGKCGNKCPQDKPFCDYGQCKLYTWSGILTNVNQDDLSPRWSECFAEPYDKDGTPITGVGGVLTKCPQANLLMACRAVSTKTLIVAAMGRRQDVTLDVGTGIAAHHIANGVAWYYNGASSWGFAMPLDGLMRNSCDTAVGLYPDRRLCWHTYNGTSTLQPGYRCGTNTNLGASFERVIFQTP